MKRHLPPYVYAKGKRGYLYFVRGSICERIKSNPGTPEFAADYARLLRGRSMAPRRTISKLIDEFMSSPKWAGYAFNTRRSHERHLAYIRDVAGHVDPSQLRTVHVYEMRDALADKPTDANRKLDTLAALLNHGKRIGWLDGNPAQGVERLKPTGRKRRPWPVDLIEAFRANASGRTLLLFELLLGTGQRIGDVLDLRWSDLDEDGFTITQGKTKTELYIPLTDRLRRVLAAETKKGFFIVCHPDGSRISYQLAHKNIMAVRREIGAEAYDIHGLRYAAASEIAAIPGMTSEHVKAITGHADAAMIRLYAGAAVQKARAQEAQKARTDKDSTKREL
ncbi:site-specific tyrosine recombinase XerC [Pseudooceanicola marinus]|uniref:Site-specific tyrosine recombinase XerC n=1 Tax=Pseudooceanicola marinus TaxID=396013 RepID=A0A1X6Z891_9RHOB|nr:tyrosine-type recombinase/integrase [Pseudooceanicola marinus]PJE28087.1 integrase [Pseudooceanicola marinus]SLN43922.1 site-specific tyrosine recombinase XerC [Pseudooceanicola marinus]